MNGSRRCLFAGLVLALTAGCLTARPEVPRGPRLGDGESCAQARPLHYRMGVVLDPEHRRLRANLIVELSCLPESELRFVLNPHFFLESAFIDDRRVPTREASLTAEGQASLAQHTLRYRGRSGASVFVELRYEGKLRRTGTPLNELSEDLIELSRHSAWYPRFEGMEPFTAELSVYAPSRFRLVAQGRPAPSLSVSKVDGGASREWSWSVEEPASDLVIVGAPHLRSLDVVDRDERVTSYYSTLPSQLVEVMTATLAHGRAYLRDALGDGLGQGTSMQVFVPRGGAGYRSSALNITSEETVRTSSSSAAWLILELSRLWWRVPEDEGVSTGEEDALAYYYAGRLVADQSRAMDVPATVALLSELERQVGRSAIDQVLKELRLRIRARPIPWPTLDAALRAAFGDALLNALGRRLGQSSEATEGEEQDERDDQDRE